MLRDIDTQFGHHFDRDGMHVSSRIGARAVDFEKVRSHVAKQSFGKVRTTRISGAENENFFQNK